jgi:hypothetical protein
MTRKDDRQTFFVGRAFRHDIMAAFLQGFQPLKVRHYKRQAFYFKALREILSNLRVHSVR